jgi:hypothetical protein
MADRVNLCDNPALKNNNTGWGGGSTPTRSTGLTGLPRTTGAHYTANGYAQTPTAVAAPATVYTASLYLQNNTGFSLGFKTIYLAFTRSAGGDDFSQTKSVELPTGVTRIDFTGTSPALTTGLYVIVDSFNASLGSGVELTACLIEQAGALDTYFDGDTAGASWDGSDGNSTSTLSTGLTQALPVAVDTSTAVTLGRMKSRALPVAAETSSGLTIIGSKMRALPTVAEVDTSITLGRVKSRTLPVAAETSSALTLVASKRRALPVAAETDTAGALGGAVPVEPAGVGARHAQSTPLGRRVQSTPKGRRT